MKTCKTLSGRLSRIWVEYTRSAYMQKHDATAELRRVSVGGVNTIRN